ncbi:MAG: hypothetical protein Q8P61_02205 [Candidatus Nanopelagicales bacterium]|nr:hypothetical protein [Candidatus Nanopelagicales bacterium]
MAAKDKTTKNQAKQRRKPGVMRKLASTKQVPAKHSTAQILEEIRGERYRNGS